MSIYQRRMCNISVQSVIVLDTFVVDNSILGNANTWIAKIVCTVILTVFLVSAGTLKSWFRKLVFFKLTWTAAVWSIELSHLPMLFPSLVGQTFWALSWSHLEKSLDLCYINYVQQNEDSPAICGIENFNFFAIFTLHVGYSSSWHLTRDCSFH